MYVWGGVGHMMREVRPLPGPCRPHPGQPGPPSQGLRCGLRQQPGSRGPDGLPSRKKPFLTGKGEVRGGGRLGSV